MTSVLVTGATGAQGKAAARALLAAGHKVRALTRAPSSLDAQALAILGAEIAAGDFDDRASLAAACTGMTGLFSVQLPSPPDDPEREHRHGAALIGAARAAGIAVCVHTSVARADEEERFQGWREGRWPLSYWRGKSAVNALVRSAGFTHATILKPAFMMDNFVLPKVAHMMPPLAQGRIVSAMAPDTRLDLIAAADIGIFAAAAFADPSRFAGADIPLAAESLTMADVAAIMTRIGGRPVEAIHVDASTAMALGLHAGVVDSQLWAAAEGYKVDIAALARWGITLTGFADWLTARAMIRAST